MSFRDRLFEGAKRAMTDRLQGRIDGKPVAQLTDEELEQELVRRRRARAQQRSNVQRGTHGTQRDSPQQKQLLQYYANLELEPGATAADVRRAYRELMQKYHPDKHRGDAERHAAATQLARNLTDAYEALLRHLGA